MKVIIRNSVKKEKTIVDDINKLLFENMAEVKYDTPVPILPAMIELSLDEFTDLRDNFGDFLNHNADCVPHFRFIVMGRSYYVKIIIEEEVLCEG